MINNQQQGNSLNGTNQLQEQIIHSTQLASQEQQSIKSEIFPIKQILCCVLYNSPQPGMLIFTTLLTLTLEVVMVKFVFMGIHFYIGIALCIYILYLLFYLGFSDPGRAENLYKSLERHFRQEVCTDQCRHARSLSEEFCHFCYKCNSYATKTTRHCNTCNSCIVDYDHHCVFIGKCVGRNNLSQFKHFLCFIFSTLIYGLISALLTIKQVTVIGQQKA